MYTEQDYADVRRQVRRRCAALGGAALLLLAGVIGSYVLRAEWAATGLTILLAFFVIFSYDLLIRPVLAYARHLDSSLHGRTRKTTGVVKRMEEGSVLRDGVRYHPVLLNVGRRDAEEDDRLFYYDANLPPPPWQIGETVTVAAHDKALADWSRG